MAGGGIHLLSIVTTQTRKTDRLTQTDDRQRGREEGRGAEQSNLNGEGIAEEVGEPRDGREHGALHELPRPGERLPEVRLATVVMTRRVSPLLLARRR